MNYVRCIARRRLHGSAHNLIFCLKHLRKTTCVICNLCAAPKVDMASRRYFDAAYLVRGSREKAGITCSKLDTKVRLMTRRYSIHHEERLKSSPTLYPLVIGRD